VITKGETIWLTGLSGAGKSTTTEAIKTQYGAEGTRIVVLDGDDLRRGLSKDLGFSNEDRDEQVRRAGEIAIVMAHQGFIVVVALVSPRRVAREFVRSRHLESDLLFHEVYLSTPIEVCEARDPKALYRAARSGTNPLMTGVGDPYEPPLNAELVINTAECTPDEAATSVRALLNRSHN
jgi:adenylyl-sulfate kinase